MKEVVAVRTGEKDRGRDVSALRAESIDGDLVGVGRLRELAHGER